MSDGWKLFFALIFFLMALCFPIGLVWGIVVGSWKIAAVGAVIGWVGGVFGKAIGDW